MLRFAFYNISTKTIKRKRGGEREGGEGRKKYGKGTEREDMEWKKEGGREKIPGRYE